MTKKTSSSDTVTDIYSSLSLLHTHTRSDRCDLTAAQTHLLFTASSVKMFILFNVTMINLTNERFLLSCDEIKHRLQSDQSEMI